MGKITGVLKNRISQQEKLRIFVDCHVSECGTKQLQVLWDVSCGVRMIVTRLMQEPALLELGPLWFEFRSSEAC